MNPSASGWITKHLPYFIEHTLPKFLNERTTYSAFRDCGFIYGTSIKTLSGNESGGLKWTEEEITKINLFDALAITFYNSIENATEETCLHCMLEFYDLLNQKISHNDSFSRSTNKLERLIDQRVRTNESFLKKNFSHLVTNALLYIDVLAFEHFLLNDANPREYAEMLEVSIINTVCLSLDKKEFKTKYDVWLLQLFQSSVRYTVLLDDAPGTLKDLELSRFTDDIERRYVLDMACLAVWDDNEIDTKEFQFIYDLGQSLDLKAVDITESLRFVHQFIAANKHLISLFQYSNPVKHFYKHTNRTVTTLIVRNRKRLLKELSESKELVILLSQSTYRELNKTEKKKVKSQLLDICKSIPSLAIFLLPGGGILLPILIKFIPKLLPSAFNENLD